MKTHFLGVLALVFLQATSAHGECFVAPADPTDCGLVPVATAQLSVASNRLAASAAGNDGQPATADLTCFLASANYLSRCQGIDCSKMHVDVPIPLLGGWTQSKSIEFEGAPGSCAYSPARSRQESEFVSGSGTTVLETLLDTKNPKAHRMYELLIRTPCQGDDGRKTERAITASNLGTLVTDWTDNGRVSLHWGRRAGVTRQEDPSVRVIDEDTLRLAWPNGASVDLDGDGHIKASTFLAPSDWTAGLCRTDSDGTHFFPHLTLAHGQSLARIVPGFVTH